MLSPVFAAPPAQAQVANQADFVGTPLEGCAPLQVCFTDLSTGLIRGWLWDFGDGGTSTAQNPCHTYVQPGVYPVSLTVSFDCAGDVCPKDTETKTAYITVYPALTANFSGTPLDGCSPMQVCFTDLSAGTPTSWSWNFGDGGTSAAQNPCHTYTAPGTYTVSLTVANGVCGPDTETKVAYVTVEQGPNANFSGDNLTGCAPHQVCFTDLSTGNPFLWLWNFGDGSTSQSQNPCHTYQQPGVYTVSLTVENACGPDTETRTAYVIVQPAPVADFSGTPRSGCGPLQVCFTDLSTGTPTTWSWDFGDGATSNLQNPCHTYQTPGTYTVSLTVNNQYNCGPDTETKAQYIVIYPSPVADFSGTPVAGCDPLQVCFTDLSTGDPVSWNWNFGDGGTSSDQNPCHTYQAPGTYTVSLTINNEYKCGPDTETKVAYVTVDSAPNAAFSGTPLSGCGPLEVCFTDQSTGNPISWSWNFGDGAGSTAQNPCHTYQTPGTYTVSLTVDNLPGCGPDTETREAYITVYPNPVADFSGTPRTGCAPLEVCFTDLSTGEASTWLWDFGDGTSSQSQNPCHTYQSPGSYTVALTVNNRYQCGPDTETKVAYITVKGGPTAAFTGTPRNGCAPMQVCFTDQSSGNPTQWSWNFGDGSTSSQQNPCHTYGQPGTYTVSLLVANECGDDTETKVGYIVVDGPPTADFSGTPRNGCEPLQVCFTNLSSANATSWSWNFGDGATSAAKNPCYTYQNAGTYTVTLTAYNNCGSDVETKVAYIVVGEAPTANFSGTPRNGCNPPLLTQFTDLSTGNPASWSWNFGDGAGSNQQNPSHSYTQPGIYTVTLSVSNSCGADTETKVAYITVGQPPVADFAGDPVNGCVPQQVCFTDLSLGDVDNWTWNFGDGAGSNAQNPCHTYTQTGTYTVSLTISNECGTDTETKVAYITIAQAPTAAFVGGPLNGCSPLEVCFTDQSTGNPTGWLWDFGDGSSSTSKNPCHTYKQGGKFTVSLTVTNTCGSDTETKVNYVVVSPSPDADFEGEFTACMPPVYVCFLDKSVGSPTSWSWDFGDGATSTEQNPCHTYTQAGKFTVTLTVTNSCGQDIETKIGYIPVGVDPEAKYDGEPRSGCAPLDVYFTDRSTNHPTSWIWDFGDGGTSTEQHPSHTYREPGTYIVKLSVANECGLSTQTESVYITVGVSAEAPVLLSPINGEIVAPPIELCWDEPANTVKYWVQFDESPGFDPPLVHEDVSVFTLCDMVNVLDDLEGTFYWRVKSWNSCGWSDWSMPQTCLLLGTGITEPDGYGPPSSYELSQNYPNPFNANTVIMFTVPRDGAVTIAVYDILGREVVKLVNGEVFAAGVKSIAWDGLDSRGNDVPGGLYFYRMVAADFSETRKMVLLK
jgi:PKD repeat protein